MAVALTATQLAAGQSKKQGGKTRRRGNGKIGSIQPMKYAITTQKLRNKGQERRRNGKVDNVVFFVISTHMQSNEYAITTMNKAPCRVARTPAARPQPPAATTTLATP